MSKSITSTLTDAFRTKIKVFMESVIEELLSTASEMQDRLYYRLALVAGRDLRTLCEKGRAYGPSWKSRGGVGAFMMLARKWDRLTNIVSRKTDQSGSYDIFEHIRETASHKESVLETCRDLRAYLLLVEAHMTVEVDLEVDEKEGT